MSIRRPHGYVTVGCTGVEGDDRDDSFGGKGAKSDGAYSTCQLAEVLKLVNESTTTGAKLAELGLSEGAARAILAHRHGTDGDPGTADDDIYDDLDELDELDGVDFVGALALGKLVYGVLPRCEVDLATRPFMDDQTFTGQSGGWARDNAEVESVLGVQGITGQRLRSILLTQDNEGRTVYSRLRRSKLMEFRAWRVSLDATMARKTTFDSFLASHRSLSTAANRANAIAGVLTELKGENILSRLRRAGAPAGITWGARSDSKGNIALKILADRD